MSTKRKSKKQENSSDPAQNRLPDEITTSQSRQVVSVRYSAPIPPAGEFERYERTLPGAAHRILSMAESFAASTVLRDRHRIILQWVGLSMGFVIVMTGLVGGLTLVYLGKEVSGLTAFLGSIATLVGAIVYTYKNKQKPE